MTSSGPPAAKGTTNFTGRDGYASCARTGKLHHETTRAKSVRGMSRFSGNHGSRELRGMRVGCSDDDASLAQHRDLARPTLRILLRAGYRGDHRLLTSNCF